jgi:hypothetical protein
MFTHQLAKLSHYLFSYLACLNQRPGLNLWLKKLRTPAAAGVPGVPEWRLHPIITCGGPNLRPRAMHAKCIKTSQINKTNMPPGSIAVFSGLKAAMAAVMAKKKRRGWDSNPRGGCPPTGFQDRRNWPLCHPSVRPAMRHIIAAKCCDLSLRAIMPYRPPGHVGHQAMRPNCHAPTFGPCDHTCLISPTGPLAI